MVPEEADLNTFWQHIYRYRFAVPYVRGRKILDIACGEGYGSRALLDSGASSLIGVDISQEACTHATKRYGIKTQVGDVKDIPLPDASMEVIVSFETIEHVDEPHLFLDECARVLTPDGTLVISTPNLTSRDPNTPKNPFHLKELESEEFLSLIAARFNSLEVYTQCPRNTSLWSSRSLAAIEGFWQSLPGFGTLRQIIQLLFCPEAQSLERLAKARQDPIRAILSYGRNSTIANPFSIRQQKVTTREIPVYLIVVARLKKSTQK